MVRDGEIEREREREQRERERERENAVGLKRNWEREE